MMNLDLLREKALHVVENDLKHYKKALEEIDSFKGKECICNDVPSRFCDRCESMHHYNSVVQGIENKYWHG